LIGYKLIITFTGSDVHLATSNKLAGFKIRLALKHADCVTAVSQDLCAKLAADFACAHPICLANGVDGGQLRQLASLGSSPVEDDHFIYCGRLIPVKRVPFLIEAYYQSVARGCDRKLYIIGDGDELPRIKALIAAHGIQDKIVVVGALAHAEVVRAISRSRGLVLSSSNEGCPMVALECLALGRPVIAPEIGGLKDIVVHGENGYLYPAHRQDLLRDAILRIAGNKNLADLLGSAGPSSIAGKFELDAVVGHYRRIYDAIINEAH
jgi:glycosyltransferase involved in cell wall biosynthesis